MADAGKRLQQKQEAEAAAAAAAIAKIEAETSKYKLLDDIHLTHDFRSSVILPQLNKDIDPHKLVRQQEHLASLRDIPETLSPPLSPPPPSTCRSSSNSSLQDTDGSKQYQDLAAWRHQRSQNRYSNGLFGGKQRGRPKPSASKRLQDIADQDVQEETVHENPETDIAPSPAAAAAAAPDRDEDGMPSMQSARAALAMDQEDDDDEEEDDEYLDDQDEVQHEEYEPESDTEENFFFQDFSGSSKPKKRTTNNLNGRRRRSQKVMSKFDLSSFARDLHDHRLSVIQPRESRIIMTEDDELELERLLERQRQRMSVMTMSGSTDSFKVIPPLPSLDLIKPHTTTVPPPAPAQLPVTSKKEITEDLDVPTMNSDHGSSTTNSFSSANGSSPANSSRGSYPSHMEHDDQDSNKIAVESEEEDDEGITTTHVPQELLATTPKTPPTIPVSPAPVASSSSSSIRHPFKLDPLKRSVSTTSIKSNKSSSSSSPFRPAPTPLARIRDENEPAESRLHKQQARKSMSMDDMQSKLDINESSVTSSALDWINQDSRPSSRIKEFLPIQNQADAPPLLYQPAKPSKSRGLFGSLRQVSRSKTHHHSGNAGGVSSLKGLVRNFSTSHQSKPTHPSDSNAPATSSDSTGMSRAAMAVIQHNVAKHEQKKVAPVIPDDDKKQDEPSQPAQQSRRHRAKSDANNSSGSRLIAQLLSRASSSNKSKRSNSTKVVNMEQDSAAARNRAQVVRKTIIYVQPDSLHNLLKNGGDGSSIKVPPVPRPAKPQQEISVDTRNTFMSDGSLSPDDETIRSKEYFTATKVSRQTSVRKRVVEAQEASTADATASSPLSESALAHTNDHTSAGGMLSRNGSRRRWQLQSMDEDDILSTSSQQKADSYMEGVELREMSDGSVVWGVVKKQGNRKSFYAPNKQNQLELVEDGEDNDDEQDAHGEDYFRNKVMKKSNSSTTPLTHLQQQQQQQALPPPIPRRSPRRQIPVDPVLHCNNTKTDIFYSDQVTLPSLLRMMQEQQDQHEYPGDISEEEDEQDDMQQYLFNERAMSSVDDQLDEMMRILTAK
ncbi:hypothetical protein V8B55DRAFT_1562884 [Mucor lusitanicus]